MFSMMFGTYKKFQVLKIISLQFTKKVYFLKSTANTKTLFVITNKVSLDLICPSARSKARKSKKWQLTLIIISRRLTCCL